MEPTTDEISIIRSLIPDDAPVFGDAGGEYMFSDEQIGHFFTVGGGNVIRAAAFAVLAISTSEVLISKVIKTQDLSTDGSKVASALTAKAEALFAQATAMDLNDINAHFEIIDYGWNQYRPELTEYEWHL